MTMFSKNLGDPWALRSPWLRLWLGTPALHIKSKIS